MFYVYCLPLGNDPIWLIWLKPPTSQVWVVTVICFFQVIFYFLPGVNHVRDNIFGTCFQASWLSKSQQCMVYLLAFKGTWNWKGLSLVFMQVDCMQSHMSSYGNMFRFHWFSLPFSEGFFFSEGLLKISFHPPLSLKTKSRVDSPCPWLQHQVGF